MLSRWFASRLDARYRLRESLARYDATMPRKPPEPPAPPKPSFPLAGTWVLAMACPGTEHTVTLLITTANPSDVLGSDSSPTGKGTIVSGHFDGQTATFDVPYTLHGELPAQALIWGIPQNRCRRDDGNHRKYRIVHRNINIQNERPCEGRGP